MGKVLFTSADITLGIPLPWSVYGKDGTVYFQKGYIFSSKESVSRIKHLDLYHDITELLGDSIDNKEPPQAGNIIYQNSPQVAPLDIFSEIARVTDELDNIYNKIRTNPGSDAIVDVENICKTIKELIVEDDNKCLGAIHFYRKKDIKKLMPIFSVLLCEIMARDYGLDENKIKNLLMAAATAYISWNEKETERLFNPSESEKLIRNCDVIENDWLDIILLYEKIDKLIKNNIKIDCADEIKILNTVNNYLRLILPFNNKGVSPRTALQKIFKNVDPNNEHFYLFLIKQIGIYPPGSFVELSNGEIGIIVKRDKFNPLNVYIKCYKDNSDIWLSKPVMRDGRDKKYSIEAIYKETRLNTEDIISIWEK